jgi:hypothetical protein
VRFLLPSQTPASSRYQVPDTVKLSVCLANYSRLNSTVKRANGHVLNTAGHFHQPASKAPQASSSRGRGNTSALKERLKAERTERTEREEVVDAVKTVHMSVS